jgi:pimeloyl-ACP methyl ester carboxylesterase
MQIMVSVDDAQLAVDDCGSGDAIVLLHGFPLTREIWNAQAAALSKTHRVVRPDLRGMGGSTPSHGPYLMESLAGDVAATLDALGIERASVVGHSLGGYVALAFARMYVERVERLALFGARLGEDTPERARSREALAEKVEMENAIEPVLEAFLPQMLAPGASDALRARVAEIARNNGPIGAAAMLRGMAMRSSSEDIAGDITVPVLVVAGAHDPFLPPAEVAAQARAFSRGGLVTCERSGHLPMLEEPEQTNATLAGWLEA